MSSATPVTIPQGAAPGLMPAPTHDLILQALSHTPPTVFVVDNDFSIRQSLELLICSQGWQVQTFESVQDFLARPRSFVPSCLILAFSPTVLKDLEMQRQIARERSEVPIIVIAGDMDIPTTVRAVKAGAVDVFLKPFNNDHLLGAIRQSFARSHATLDRQMELHDLRNRYASLTPREQQVMDLVVSGLLNKQVGQELGISEITVKGHRGQVMQKMKATSFAHLVNIASKLRVPRSLTPSTVSG